MSSKIIQADYLLVRVNASIAGNVQLFENSMFDRPITFDGCPISLRAGGFFFADQPRLVVSDIVIFGAISFANEVSSTSIATNLTRGTPDSIPTSLAVVNYCACAVPPEGIVTLDTVTARRVVLDALTSQTCNLELRGPVTLGNVISAREYDGVLSLPAPETGRAYEIITNFRGLQIMYGTDVIFATIEPGRCLLVVANGVKWFVVDEDVNE